MTSSTQHLHPLLDELTDTRELIFRDLDADAPVAVWRTAAEDARVLYGAWCSSRGVAAHAAYLAAEDQADAALASLREAHFDRAAVERSPAS